MNPEQVIEESKPMLEETLVGLGIHNQKSRLDYQAAIEPFSDWVKTQKPDDSDVPYFAGLIGAFISEFLINERGAIRTIRDNRIIIRMELTTGIVREFEPYAVAYGMACNPSRLSLRDFIYNVQNQGK